jgi:integrase
MGIIETTCHGFRSSFRTLSMEKLGVSRSVAEHAMSHSAKSDESMGYFRGSYLPQRRALAQVWCNYIDQLKAGEPDIPALKKQLEDLTIAFEKEGF